MPDASTSGYNATSWASVAFSYNLSSATSLNQQAIQERRILDVWLNQKLVEGAMEKSKFDAICDAIFDCDLDKIDSLLVDSSVNASSESEGWNFLHMALVSVTMAPDRTVVQHLIDLGVDVNAQDRTLWTPLHFAVRSKNQAIVRVLLDAGATVNVPNNKGVTPLHLCLMTFPRNLEIVSMLISAGANLDEDHGSGTVRNYAGVAAGPDADAVLDLLNKS